jgi:hypothetical protein
MRHQNWFGGFFSRGFTQILSFWFEIFSAKLDGKNFVASCNFGPSGTSQNIDLIDLWHDTYRIRKCWSQCHGGDVVFFLEYLRISTCSTDCLLLGRPL